MKDDSTDPSTSIVPELETVFIRSVSNDDHLFIDIMLETERVNVKVRALVDSGASSLFMSPRIAKQFQRQHLRKAIPLTNIDGTPNQIGKITHQVRAVMELRGHRSRERLLVAEIGAEDVIIGIDWLKKHNPSVDWKTGELKFTRCPASCGRRGMRQRPVGKIKFGQTERTPEQDDSTEQVEEDEEEGLGKEDQPESDDQVFEVVSMERTMQIAAGFTRSQQIAEKVLRQEKTRTFEEMVPREFWRYRQVFEQKASERLPERRLGDHAINLEEGATLPNSKKYAMSPKERGALLEYLEENLAKGYIKKSESPAASPVFFIKKKDGSLRLVVDYRKLNAITIKDRFPLPLTQSLLDRLAEAYWFTALDLRWGYNNIRIRKGDQYKAAFVTEEGLYEPEVMGFGLCNAPATFQREMQRIFQDMEDVVVYLDDILIFSRTRESHQATVLEVLRRLQENDLFCKPEKCKFFQKETEYLGFLISHNQIRMDPAKVQAILEWPDPLTIKQIQELLGFGNFYRRFIEGYSELVRPLTSLLRKGRVFEWGEEQKETFRRYKEKFRDAPVLIIPNPEKPYVVECDASDFAVGAVLSQKGEDGNMHPIAFMSKAMNAAERNYQIYDKELLAVISALKQWRQYLEGARHKVTILSDHQNLQYFGGAQTLTRRQARWGLFLTRFDYEIKHRPGRLGGKPDKLSRRPDHKPDIPDNQGWQVLQLDSPGVLQPAAVRICAMKRGHASELQDHPIRKRIRQEVEYDPEVKEALKLLKVGPRQLRKGLEDWNLEDGLVLFQGKVCVPDNPGIRRDLVRLHHDSLEVGHPGTYKTMELISRNYWWPGMTKYIKHYVETCDTCNRKKNWSQKPKGELRPIQPADRPWQVATNDFIVGLPKSEGYDGIWVVADHLTKEAHFVPIKSDIDTEETIDLYLQHVWKLHGVPEKMISDRGTQFTSKLMRGVFKKLGIQGAYSTAYHPQTDGQTERINQTLKQYLRLFCRYRQNDWSQYLPMAEFAYNNSASTTTKLSPFYAARGYHPRMTFETGTETNVPKAEEMISHLHQVQEELKAAMRLSQEQMTQYYNRGREQEPKLEVGQKVWLDARNITTTAPSPTLADRRLGPFEIEEAVSEVDYRLKLPSQVQIHPVFHISLLHPHKESMIPGRVEPPPPPVEVEGEEEYEIQEIKDGRMWRGQKQYLVSWEGYGPNEDMWLPEKGLGHAKEAIQQFHDTHPEFVWMTAKRRKA